MGILKKVKNLVTGDDTAEEKPKKTRAKKAATSDATVEAPKKKTAAKKAAPKAEVAAAEPHDHDHDHEGHDHKHESQDVVGLLIGTGATQFMLTPMITEKGTLVAANNTYLFKAAPHATKGAIKQAVEKLYKVNVLKIRTSRYDGKVVRYGRTEGRRSNFKKVYITVAKGQSIAIHKGV